MRNTNFNMRIAPTEKKALMELANIKGVSMADYIRLRINEDWEVVKERLARYSTGKDNSAV